MNRTLLLFCAIALASLCVWAADAAAPVVKAPGDIDFHASGSLPPGAEYHLIYEEPKTHAVELIVRMPKGYVLPPHLRRDDFHAQGKTPPPLRGSRGKCRRRRLRGDPVGNRLHDDRRWLRRRAVRRRVQRAV